MGETTYYKKNREITLGKAEEEYENNKERLREQARDKYRISSDELIIR